ncbi:hypothetical protein VTO42DRAFT_7591 [Malbranchea cinnamomea]
MNRRLSEVCSLRKPTKARGPLSGLCRRSRISWHTTWRFRQLLYTEIPGGIRLALFVVCRPTPPILDERFLPRGSYDTDVFGKTIIE